MSWPCAVARVRSKSEKSFMMRKVGKGMEGGRSRSWLRLLMGNVVGGWRGERKSGELKREGFVHF